MKFVFFIDVDGNVFLQSDFTLPQYEFSKNIILEVKNNWSTVTNHTNFPWILRTEVRVFIEKQCLVLENTALKDVKMVLAQISQVIKMDINAQKQKDLLVEFVGLFDNFGAVNLWHGAQTSPEADRQWSKIASVVARAKNLT